MKLEIGTPVIIYSENHPFYHKNDINCKKPNFSIRGKVEEVDEYEGSFMYKVCGEWWDQSQIEVDTARFIKENCN